MIKKSLGLAVATLLSFVPLSGAEATLITWAYSGIVTAESGSIFTVGQTVTGTFVFDDATLMSAGNGTTTADYAGAVVKFTIDGLPSATLTSTDPSIDTNTILIRDNSPANRDNFTANLEDLTASTPASDLDKSFQLILDARDTVAPLANPPCINSVALPGLPYSLACFDGFTNVTSLVARNTTTTDPAARFTLTLDLQSISSRAPLPGTLALLVLGVASLGTLACRRRR
jgi:hypothetical protein